MKEVRVRFRATQKSKSVCHSPKKILLSEILLLKPDPESVSLVPPINDPYSGETLWTSKIYSTEAFTLLLWETILVI